MTVRLLHSSPPVPSAASIAPRLIVFGLIPTVLAAWLIIDPSHAKFDDSLDLQAKAKYAEAAERASAAAAAVPSSAAYQIHAGVSQALPFLNQDETGAEETTERLNESIAHFKRGIIADPRSALAYANLAQALRLAGDAPASGSGCPYGPDSRSPGRDHSRARWHDP